MEKTYYVVLFEFCYGVYSRRKYIPRGVLGVQTLRAHNIEHAATLGRDAAMAMRSYKT